MAVQITQGTQTPIYSKLSSGTEVQVVKLDIGAGTALADFGGTIADVTKVTNLAKGTITKVEGGTLGVLGAGTITKLEGGTLGVLAAGTVDTIGLRHADAFATVVSTGTLTMGTIKPAVSGSVIYVTDLVISAGSATNVNIASGGTSTPMLGTLYLAAQGGAVMNFRQPLATASGSALVYKQSAAVSPLSITCLGYVD